MKKLFRNLTPQGQLAKQAKPSPKRPIAYYLFSLLAVLVLSTNSVWGQNFVYRMSSNLANGSTINAHQVTRFNSLIPVDNGNYIVTGYTSTISGGNTERPFIAKLNSSFNVIWTRIIKDIAGYELTDVCYDGTSYWAVGARIVPSTGTNGLDTYGFAWRLDLNGTTLFRNAYSITDNSPVSTTNASNITRRWATFRYIKIVGGNAIISGHTSRTTNTTGVESDILAVCLDGTGAIVWKNSYDHTLGSSNNNYQDNFGSGVLFTTKRVGYNNKVFICGATGSTPSTSAPQNEIIEVNPTTGAIIRSARYNQVPTASSNLRETAYNLLETSTGDLILIGIKFLSASQTQWDVIVQKINPENLDLIWAKTYSWKTIDKGYSAVLDADDVLYINGSTDNPSQLFTLAINASSNDPATEGNVITSKTRAYDGPNANSASLAEVAGLNSGMMFNGVNYTAANTTDFTGNFPASTPATTWLGFIVIDNLAKDENCNSIEATFTESDYPMTKADDFVEFTPLVEIFKSDYEIYSTGVLAKRPTCCTEVVITSPTQVCQGNSITLTASVPSALPGQQYSYTWAAITANTSTPLPGGASLTVTPTASIGYSVTATLTSNGIPCSVTALQNITVNPRPNIVLSANPPYLCPNVTSTTITATGANTYLWSNAATTASISVSPTTTTNYNVTGTSTAGCTATGQQQIQVLSSCCITPTTPYITIGTSSSSFVQLSSLIPSQLPAAGANNLVICVNGLFEINQNYTFTNCTFKMGSGATILVQGNSRKTLRLINCDLRNQCNQMWRGIQLTSSTIAAGGGEVYVSGTTIEDALYGINMGLNTLTNVQTSTFNKCFIGLYAPNRNSTGPSTTDIVRLNLNSTTFKCTSNLLPTWSSAVVTPVPYPCNGISTMNVPIGTRTYAGVFFNDIYGTDINTGTPWIYITDCSFLDLTKGCVFDQCGTARIARCRFDNIQPSTYTLPNCNNNPTLNWEGAAIFSNGVASISSLIQSGGAYSPDFNNCRYGIFTRRTEVNSTLTTMEAPTLNSGSVSTGYQIELCQNGQAITIDGNIVRVRDAAVRISECNPADIQVTNNTLFAGSYGSAPFTTPLISSGVEVTNGGLGVGNGHNCLIADNTISLGNGSINSGIWSSNGGNMQIKSNTIKLYNTNLNNGIYGIRLQGGSTIRVNCNRIGFGNSSSFPIPAPTPHLNAAHAINISSTTDTWLTNNETENTRVGLWVNGPNIGCQLRMNKFNQHYWGHWYQSNGSITAQGSATSHLGNRWYNSTYSYPQAAGQSGTPYLGAAIRHDGLSNNIPNSQFFAIGLTAALPYLYAPTNTTCLFTMGGTYGNMFVNTSATCVFPCGTTWTCENYQSRPAGDSLSSLEKAVMQGDIQTADYTESQNWTLDNSLYTTLKEQPDLLVSNPDAIDFIDDKSTSTEGAFWSVKEQFEQAVVWQTQQKQLLLQNEQLIVSLNQQIAVLDSISHADSIDNSLLINTYTQQIEQLRWNNQNIINTFEQNKMDKADLALAQNAQVVDTKVVEYNEKVINEIYLTSILKGNGSFTSEQLQTLQSVAQQCPLSGGNAVYRARSMYGLVAEVWYNDEANCEAAGYNWEEKQTPVQLTGYNLVPNPAKDNVSLIYPIQESATDLVIELVDVLGKVVYSTPIDGRWGQYDINISQLSEGLYFCRVRNAHTNLYTTKLVVTK